MNNYNYLQIKHFDCTKGNASKNADGITSIVGTGQIALQSGPEVIKLFSSSILLSMKFFLLSNVKMPTIFENGILGLSGPKKHIFHIFIVITI